MYDNYYAVIMAGGGGTRLWPMSRKDRPKQMLNLGQERSLFQLAVDRLEGLFPPERILVVTVEDQAAALKEQSPAIPDENFLLETMPRGTASVVGYAATILGKRDPGAVMAILTADHIIGNLGLFHQVLKAGYQAAGENYLVTLGIAPTYPATGYGYTRRGDLIGKFQDLDVFHVQEFTEKPQLEEAERMVESGQYAWNSGMFIWKTDQILKEIREQMPDLASQLEMIGRAWDTEEQDKVIREIWPDIQPQTIDFGIMEGASRVAVVPAGDLGWSDVGSWEALYDLLTADELGNIFREIEHVALDTKGTILYGMGQSRMVVTIGIEDLIIIDTEDVLLVCTKEQAQEVRQAVRELERLERTDLL